MFFGYAVAPVHWALILDDEQARAKAALASRKAQTPFDRVTARAELDGMIGRLGAANA